MNARKLGRGEGGRCAGEMQPAGRGHVACTCRQPANSTKHTYPSCERTRAVQTADRTYMSDDWLAADKAQHLCACFAATWLGYAAASMSAAARSGWFKFAHTHTRRVAVGVAVGMTVGVAKEVLDALDVRRLRCTQHAAAPDARPPLLHSCGPPVDSRLSATWQQTRWGACSQLASCTCEQQGMQARLHSRNPRTSVCSA
jgi:uncharacterized protein YfiM (DUF2279 family)